MKTAFGIAVLLLLSAIVLLLVSINGQLLKSTSEGPRKSDCEKAADALCGGPDDRKCYAAVLIKCGGN
jgi:hypothetical protein